jgi:hypothetical protein
MGWQYVPLWALLPALANRETAKRYLKEGHKWLGRELTPQERAYLEDVIRQGNHVEQRLREWGFYDPGARGKLLRYHGISADTEEEARRILAELEGEGRV